VVTADAAQLDLARRSILDIMGAEALVDCAGVIALFEAIDRVADATGQPVETEMVERSAPIRAQLGIDAFAATKSELDSDRVKSSDGSNGK
jgi:hypothetical protein